VRDANKLRSITVLADTPADMFKKEMRAHV
jgi:hypothetical protein